MTYVGKYSPSLLDAFQSYLDSEMLYEKLFGSSEEPSYTYEEFEAEKRQDLIDKINRVPFESVPADKGSCFNEIVDCIVLNQKSTREDISLRTVKGEGSYIEAKKGDNIFMFDTNLCRTMAEYFKNSLCQIYTEASIETKYGTILLYGYPDYVREDMVYDLKTTSRYEFGKYSKYWQQHVYPYTLIESGKCADIKAFEFTAVLLKGGTAKSPLLTGDIYPEYYKYDHKASTGRLRAICEQFYEFLINNRSLIVDEKIYGGEKKA